MGISAFAPLRSYLESKGHFTEQEFGLLEALFSPATLRPGEFLQRAGESVRHAAFVAMGCLRSYVIDATGKEVTLEFAPENWWLGDRTFLVGGTTCECFIDSIGHSDLLLFDQASLQKMIECVPAFAAMFRVAFQKYAAAKDRRIINALSMSTEERYLEFLKTYPGIALHVPQRMLASYLGVSPETLSRVRKHLSHK
jgi:CRP-like cAMP-binding protein